MSEYRYIPLSEFQFFDNNKNDTNLPIQPYHQNYHNQLLTAAVKKSNYKKYPEVELNVPYTIFEILVAIIAIIGNLMVIIVFKKDKKLRRRTNYYIVSLAIADFLVGLLGVPFAILASVGQPRNLHACLFTVSLLIVLCTISIFCLVAVSIDRYWAILYPMAYSRNVRTKTAIGIISMCWLAGSFVGFLPLLGWHANVKENQSCLFVEVMDYNYLVFLYFATIITPALVLLAFYAHIYRVIVKQVHQRTMNPIGEKYKNRKLSILQLQNNSTRFHHGGTMLRVLGAARKRDVKATQNLSIIVLFFMICWIPLYSINCIKAFCPECYVHPKLTFFCIILSHLNSAVNPILYAYHLKDFRQALKNLILTIVGIEIEQPQNLNYRFSLGSQHRLQSITDKRTPSLHNRIYIDSPVWLSQQQQHQLQLQQQQELIKTSTISPIVHSLNNVHQTVAAVASSATEVNHDIWKIFEISNYKEDNIRYSKTNDEADDDSSNPDNRQYSYENKDYSCSVNDLHDDEVFLSQENRNFKDNRKSSPLISYMRKRLKTDDHDYLNHFKVIHPLFDSFSTPCSSHYSTTESFSTATVRKDTNSSHSINQNSLYTIENDENLLSSTHKIIITKTTTSKVPTIKTATNMGNDTELLSPLKTVSNIFSKKTSSMLHISEYFTTKAIVRKRTQQIVKKERQKSL